jgi:S-adenosylmethionine decarboxylase
VNALGTHILCELSGCDPSDLNDVDDVRATMVAAAHEARAEVREVAFHRFLPHGVSGVVVLSESHIAIHTWPETGYAAIDVYTCGAKAQPWKAIKFLAKMFRASSMLTTEVKRGIESSNGQFSHVVLDGENTGLTRLSA